MEGELGFAAMTSSTSSSTMSSCPRPNKPADEPGCVWEFDEDKFEWECIPEIVIIGVPEDEGCKPGEACWDDSCPFGEICDEGLPEDELPEEPPELCPVALTSNLDISVGSNQTELLNATNIQACEKPASECDILIEKIEIAKNGIARRFRQLFENVGGIDQTTHWEQLYGRQRGLRNLLLQAETLGCESIPSDAWYWATK